MPILNATAVTQLAASAERPIFISIAPLASSGLTKINVLSYGLTRIKE